MNNDVQTKNTGVLQKAISLLHAGACNEKSPTKKLGCMNPKGHVGLHSVLIKVEWEKDKETMKKAF